MNKRQADSIGAMPQDEFDQKFGPVLATIDKWKLPDCIRKMEEAVAKLLNDNRKLKRIEKMHRLAETRLESRRLRRTFKQLQKAAHRAFIPHGAPQGYREYLASAEWLDIRSRVMERDRNTCMVCGEKASQVHHRRYDESTMRGETLFWLLAICGECHEHIHIEDDVKLPAVMVNRRLTARRLLNYPESQVLLDHHIDWEAVIAANRKDGAK